MAVATTASSNAIRATPMLQMAPMATIRGATAIVAMPTGEAAPRLQRRAHSHAIRPPVTAMRMSQKGRPRNAATSGIGARTSADITRCRRALRSVGGTVSTVAAVIFADGIFEIALGKIRPQAIEKNQLGIGQLPEQEIADALFAAGADDEIGIGNPGGEEMS